MKEHMVQLILVIAISFIAIHVESDGYEVAEVVESK